MKLDSQAAKLIGELEYYVGSECYNPNSYNGWTGDEGCEFRYPVTYCKTEEDLKKHIASKTKGEILDLVPECVTTVKYAFGSNHLYIGNAIQSILEELEYRFGLDFNELLEKEHEQKIIHASEIQKAFDNGSEITVPEGNSLVVGLDIPYGKAVFYNTDNAKPYLYPSIFVYSESGELIGMTHIFPKQQTPIELIQGQSVSISMPVIMRKSV